MPNATKTTQDTELSFFTSLDQKAKTAPPRTRETAPPRKEGTWKKADQAIDANDPLAAKYNVRNISSLELTMLSNELYSAGRIGREELAMLAFQPEMNANYDNVGAEGVGRPDPNRKRDAVAEWETILLRQMEFNNSPYFIEQTRGVVNLLRSLAKAHRASKKK